VLAISDELSDRYGEPPEPVLNLLEVARLRTAARRAGLTDITAAGNHIRFAPVDLPDSRQVRVQRLYPKTVLKPAVRTMLVPVPKTASIGGQPLRDTELLAWCGEVIRSVLADLAVGVLFRMKGSSPVLRRLIAVSAAVLGVGLVVTGCSSVKFGAAAIVGNQRITLATLDTEVTNLSQTAKLYPGTVTLSPTQEIQQTLSWLVRFQINEQLARTEGITISTGQAQTALAQIYAASKSQAESEGLSNVTLNLILAANGIPPNLATEVGRYQAIETQFVEQVNGGKIPTATAAQTATTAKLERAQCEAAKTLQIQINPQFGRLNYSQYAVVSAPSTVSRAEGKATAASTSGLTPAC